MSARREAGTVLSDVLFAGAGEMAGRMRALDWSRTEIGPAASWPTSLRTIVAVALASRFPMLVWWGPRFVQLYNDGYRPILGAKHPASLGASGPEVWAEIWHIIGPMAHGVLAGGPATWSENLMLPMNRKGFVEETYFSFSYSAVPDDVGSVGGVLVTCQETTEQVQDERQLRLLRDLTARASEAQDAEHALRNAADALREYPQDVPFGLLYLADEAGAQAELVASVGLDGHQGKSPPARLRLGAAGGAASWPLAVADPAAAAVIDDLAEHLGPLPSFGIEEPVTRAVVQPLASAGERPYGYLVAGLSPRRSFDERYRGLFRLAAGQVSTAIANARAYEDQRRRAEALAEVDRAKTTFFSNVSHEFRTPLTLMIGPTEDALASPDRVLRGEDLETVHRNELRLLKLVNTLLDFSRFEAGRAAARYEPTDLAALTADLASSFRSAVERAGLRFVVDCPPLPFEVHVDREMWEKIVLNLLSNAFKFTSEGEISVSLRARGEEAELAVRDTGVGIPAEQVPQLFRRFHRVHSEWARSFEGSGIGLALVRDLASLHGGAVGVETAPGEGSTFTVTIPRGSAHLPAESVSTAASHARPALARAFVQEALSWLPDAVGEAPRAIAGVDPSGPAVATAAGRADGAANERILVVDDNADMRAYLHRILSPRFLVTLASDGAAALASARAEPPALVLADVMMPGLDGFALLHALRDDPRTSAVPVVMLSARAGEESAIEGLRAGAADYLVKPFSARELLARIAAQLAARRAQEAVDRSHREIAEAGRRRAEEASRAKDDFLAILAHELRNPLAPLRTGLDLIRLGADEPEVVARALASMERQLGHLQRLVDDLLEVSRLKLGKIELRRERVELAAVAAAAVEAQVTALVAAGVELTVDVPQGLLVDGDPVRLAQVVSNLLHNAAKFTPAGGSVGLHGREDGDVAELVVRDTGSGMTDEQLASVFELFVQAPSTGPARAGLGIGLTLARTLAELHGGSLAAASAGPGRGSELTLRLPRAVAPTAESTPRAEEGLPAGGDEMFAKRVLVVDDNADAASALAELLRLLGAYAEPVFDGPMALEAVDRLRPEVVFLDLSMPGMDGFEVARRLRERGVQAWLVALSGFGQEDDRLRTASAGFDQHLIKPADLGNVREAMARAAAARERPLSPSA